MPKDIELEVLHPQALQKLHAEKAAAQGRAVTAALEAERRVRLAEDQLGDVKTEGQRAAIRRIGDQIRYSPALYPWMRAYAEWLTLQCVEPPTRTGRRAKARFFASAPVSDKQLVALEARADFVSYVNELQSGPIERARARFAAAFPEYVEAHKAALDAARDANDYNAMARIAEPVLDRVMPKKAEGGQATQVNITLSPNQLAGVSDAYAPPPMVVDEVVAEVIPE